MLLLNGGVCCLLLLGRRLLLLVVVVKGDDSDLTLLVERLLLCDRGIGGGGIGDVLGLGVNGDELIRHVLLMEEIIFAIVGSAVTVRACC